MTTQTEKLQPGNPAPDFTLPSTHGEQSLSDHQGEWVVLYFYPKDETPGCTQEACDFRDLSANLDAAVLGVSTDSLDSHQKFAANHNLSFPLLSDESAEVAKAYGTFGPKVIFGKEREVTLRSTFIIGPDGKIREAMYNVKSDGHAAEVAKKLDALKASA
ncbi:MAG: peroxiredoxin [Trueperaceae bacterium]|nr:peroxiredoxin [Trueperaceae bacterium]